jgi:hypothetical protein
MAGESFTMTLWGGVDSPYDESFIFDAYQITLNCMHPLRLRSAGSL